MLTSSCASMTLTPDESRRNDAYWEAARECASGLGTITVDRVDHLGRIWYYTTQGSQTDVPKFDACYQRKARENIRKLSP